MRKNRRSIRDALSGVAALVFCVAGLPACSGGMSIHGPSITVEPPGSGGTTWFATRTWSEELPLDGWQRLRLDARNGDVILRGEPGITQVTATAILRAGSTSLADAKTGVDALEILVTETAEEVVVETVHPASPAGRVYQIDYAITVPDYLPVELSQANGTVKVTGMSCPVRIELANGEARLEDQRGAAAVNVANGGIYAEVDLPAGETIEFILENGNIDLRVPASTSATLDARSARGTVRLTGLDLLGAVETPGRVTGTLGSGTGQIDVAIAQHGNIELSQMEGAW